MIGEPSCEECQSIPANLSGSFDPNRADTSFCFSVSTWTQNRPLASMPFHDRDTFVGQNSTSGGSSDSAANDWQAKPIGASACTGGMVVIPVPKWPRTCRKARGSIGADMANLELGPEADREVVAPQAHGGAFPGDPVAVIDFSTLTTEFDVESTGRLHVERKHQVVDMAAQRGRHRHL